MWNCNPFSKPRRSQCFAGEEHLIKKLAVHLFGQLDHVNNGVEHRCLVRPPNPVMHSASPECFTQRWRRHFTTIRLGEDLGGYIDSPRRRPFQKLSSVEAVLIADLVCWDHALLDPAVNCFLRYV